jgi:hypothetical protein
MCLLIATQNLAQVVTSRRDTVSAHRLLAEQLPRSRLASRQVLVFTLIHDVDGPKRQTLALLVLRADELMGCTEGSPEEAELETLADATSPCAGRRGQDCRWEG